MLSLVKSSHNGDYCLSLTQNSIMSHVSKSVLYKNRTYCCRTTSQPPIWRGSCCPRTPPCHRVWCISSPESPIYPARSKNRPYIWWIIPKQSKTYTHVWTRNCSTINLATSSSKTVVTLMYVLIDIEYHCYWALFSINFPITFFHFLFYALDSTHNKRRKIRSKCVIFFGEYIRSGVHFILDS